MFQSNTYQSCQNPNQQSQNTYQSSQIPISPVEILTSKVNQI